ncbi:Xaa-Pro aminopeptidase [Candidatus Phytoplasma australiense]|uniref:Xaa-Pro aminopeptidase n=1 Tax=Phytoplasma australiense TaxID=59748 RepID=B1VAP0_PHYAS|nr:Xaa-Pro aminopeptidase [Candidatus Phytoplasma australiense]
MFLQNRDNLIQKMEQNTAAVFFSGKKIVKSGDQFFPFEVDHNFYYLTGINQPNSILFIKKTASGSQVFLFLDERDPQKALWDGDLLSFSEASKISCLKEEKIQKNTLFNSFLLETINPLRSFSTASIDAFYFDLSSSSRNLTQENNQALMFCQKLLSLYPFLKIKNSSPFLLALRQSKNLYEQTQIKKALEINAQSLTQLMTQIKPLNNENDVASFFRYFLEKNQTKEAFDTIAASGKNALVLHYIRNSAQLNHNEVLLFDAGVNYNHYSSDITRCYPIGGVFTPFQKQIYNLVLKANKAIISFVRPHHTLAQLNHYGKNILAEGLKELSLWQENDRIDNYCYHGLCHHLGLDVHDVCNYSDIIGENSVITVEPGLYFQKFNLGIRIEDDILVTKNGAINLSQKIPKEITEIEALMKSFC